MTSFIATLNSTPDPTHEGTFDSSDWEAVWLTPRVTPNGQYLAFESIEELTGYDNVDVSTGERDDEIYLYDASHNALRCVSCIPTRTISTA